MSVRAPSRHDWTLFPPNRLDVLLSITCIRLKDETRQKIDANLKVFEPYSDKKLNFPIQYELGKTLDFEAGVGKKLQEAEIQNFPINCWISPSQKSADADDLPSTDRIFFLTNG